jgi:hypothetical protein
VQQVLEALKSEGMSLQKIHVFLNQALKDVEVRCSRQACVTAQLMRTPATLMLHVRCW